MSDPCPIIIPTRGRRDDQLTVQNLPKSLMKRVTLVCPQKEFNYLRSLREDYNVIAEPHEMLIAQKRGWIVKKWLEEGHTKIFLLDDDLRFATRISDNDWHLRPITDNELLAEFQHMEEKLSPEFPHIGFGIRQGNNTLEEAGWKTPAKQVCTFGYYLPIVREANWDLLVLRSDMCTTLQLLLKGYPNAVWTQTVVDQRGFDAPGGCSIFRTVALANTEAEKFAQLFPEYVTVTSRKYKDPEKKLNSRLEVIVQWQKALEDGRRNHVRNSCS